MSDDEKPKSEEAPQAEQAQVQSTAPEPKEEPKEDWGYTVGKEKRMSKLQKLKCWPEVKAMLENSRPVADIVHHIQVVREEYLEIQPRSLQTIIYQWMARHQDEFLDTRIPTKYLNLLDSNIEKVDPTDAVNMIFSIHMDRIMMDYSNERRERKSDYQNTQNLKLANEMIRTMSFLKSDSFKQRLAQLEAKEGSSKGVRETFESIDRVKKAYEERFGQKAAAVMLNPESRAKVYSALAHVRKGDSAQVIELLKRNTAKAEELAREEAQRDSAESTPIPEDEIE